MAAADVRRPRPGVAKPLLDDHPGRAWSRPVVVAGPAAIDPANA